MIIIYDSTFFQIHFHITFPIMQYVKSGMCKTLKCWPALYIHLVSGKQANMCGMSCEA